MNPMTPAGAELLRNELEKLTKQERPRIIQAIADARELGDLKENAEYHTAKDRQGMVEARILDIESKLRNAQVIDITKIPPSGKVLFGCTVTLRDLAAKKNIKYRIVGDDEADATDHKISYSSPVAKAMIGKPVREEIEIDLPDNKLHYRISKIEHI